MQVKLSSTWLADCCFFFIFFLFSAKRNHLFFSFLYYLYNRYSIPIVFPRKTHIVFRDVAPMQQKKQRYTKKKPVLLSLVFGYKSSTVQEVRAVSCPDCRGLSLKSWCLSPSRCHCGYPLPGFSLAVVCGLRRDEPTSPGSRNGHASPQMGPGKRQRHVWKRKRLPFIIFTFPAHTVLSQSHVILHY